MRLWHRRTCATFTVVVTPSITTISWLQSRASVRILQGRLLARHLRQHEDGGGDDLHRQGSAIQSPLPPDVLAPSCRACRLHAGGGLGEGSGREQGRPGARALLHAALARREL